ncbi:hypothetical protein ACFOLD_16880 [Kocuria carniphila]|uniref:hypothetical protein n=1 Tax=Kocuria carniphila TaxID=262208 RepID=UPI00361F5577
MLLGLSITLVVYVLVSIFTVAIVPIGQLGESPPRCWTWYVSAHRVFRSTPSTRS